MPSRRLLIAALALTATAAIAHPQERNRLPPGTNAIQIEGEVLAFRVSLADAIRAKDVAKLRDLYTVDYTQTHSSGQTDGRDARILSLLAGDPVVETLPPAELLIRVFGPDTAVATGRTAIPGSTTEVRWTAVYVKLEGAWRLASSQITRIAGSA